MRAAAVSAEVCHRLLLRDKQEQRALLRVGFCGSRHHSPSGVKAHQRVERGFWVDHGDIGFVAELPLTEGRENGEPDPR